MCDPAVTFPGKFKEAHDWYINFHVQPKSGSAFDSDPDQPLPPAAESQKANILKNKQSFHCGIKSNSEM